MANSQETKKDVFEKHMLDSSMCCETIVVRPTVICSNPFSKGITLISANQTANFTKQNQKKKTLSKESHVSNTFSKNSSLKEKSSANSIASIGNESDGKEKLPKEAKSFELYAKKIDSHQKLDKNSGKRKRFDKDDEEEYGSDDLPKKREKVPIKANASNISPNTNKSPQLIRIKTSNKATASSSSSTPAVACSSSETVVSVKKRKRRKGIICSIPLYKLLHITYLKQTANVTRFNSDKDDEKEYRNEDSSNSKGSLTSAHIAVLRFFQEASLKDLGLIPGCSKREIEAISNLRPFSKWSDLVKKLENDEVLSIDLLNGAKKVLYMINTTTKQKKRIKDLEDLVEKLKERKATSSDCASKQPMLLNERKYLFQENEVPSSQHRTGTQSSSELKPKETGALELILKNQKSILLGIQELKKSVDRLTNQNVNADLGNFPLMDECSLNSLEEKLRCHDNQVYFVRQLRRFGGHTWNERARKIMRYIFSDELAGDYNWKGVGGKRRFAALTLSSLIVDAVCEDQPAVARAAVENAITVWLKQSKRRKNYIKKRKNM